MEWQILIVLMAAIPIILLPAAIIYYLHISGIYANIKEARRIARERENQAKTGTK